MSGQCRSDRLRHPARPCGDCPWRRDSTPGQFPPERYDALLSTCRGPGGGNAEFGAALFACHKTPDGRETACAGFLAVEGWSNLSVRMAVIDGRLDPAALEPGPDWPALYESYEELHQVNSADAVAEHQRLTGPHTLDCPAWGEDPAGIEQCQCSPTDREATRP